MTNADEEAADASPRVKLLLRDSNGSEVLNMELSFDEALFEVRTFFEAQCCVGFDGSIYFDPVETDA